jgi:acyl-CoA thioester hydrolase
MYQSQHADAWPDPSPRRDADDESACAVVRITEDGREPGARQQFPGGEPRGAQQLEKRRSHYRRQLVTDAVASGPTSSFGELPVLPGGAGSPRTARGGVLHSYADSNPERVFLNDLLAPVPTAKVGDRLPGAVDGVLDYSFGNYKLERDVGALEHTAAAHRHPWARATASEDLAVALGGPGSRRTAEARRSLETAAARFDEMGARPPLASSSPATAVRLSRKDHYMTDPFTLRMTVRGYETDAQGHLNGIVYLQYAEHLRWELLRAAGLRQSALLANGLGPVNLETTIRYHRELRAGDDVDVSCAFRWGDGKSFRVEQAFRAPDGGLVADVSNVGGLLDLRARSLVPDPAGRFRELCDVPGVLGL